MSMDNQTQNQEIGFCLSSKNYLTYLDGLPTIKVNDLVQSSEGLRGIVNILHSNMVEVLMLDEGSISPGQMFKKTGSNLSIPVGEFLLGRSINALGLPIDGKGSLAKSRSYTLLELERPARGIDSREFITEQLITGMSIMDNLIPLGRGQRELIVGDSHSGVTQFLVNLVINLSKSDTICVYTVIGKPVIAIKNLINTLEVNKAMDHTVIVASSSTEPTPLIFLTPKAAFSVAEYFQSQGKDVLIILDDMGNHAKIYREISLLGGRSPGRESYPGDIFYQQAHIMERAGRFNSKAGGGSITAIPVIEINLNDLTGFIPTNLMSITDGHLLFKSNLYNKNLRPAIDISLSVSRVGTQTQTLLNSLLSRRIKQILAEAEGLETISRFSAELPPETQLVLRRKGLIEEIIRQEDLTSVPLPIQTVLLGLVFSSFLRDKDDVFMRRFKDILIKSFTTDPELSRISQECLKLKSEVDLVRMLEAVGPKLAEICK